MQNGSVWAYNDRQFSIMWKREVQTIFFIPKNFLDQWGHELRPEVVITDPAGNCFDCVIKRTVDGAYFWADFAMKVIRRYQINRPVRMHFELIDGGHLLMRITIDGEGEISYPIVKSRPLLF